MKLLAYRGPTAPNARPSGSFERQGVRTFSSKQTDKYFAEQTGQYEGGNAFGQTDRQIAGQTPSENLFGQTARQTESTNYMFFFHYPI